MIGGFLKIVLLLFIWALLALLVGMFIWPKIAEYMTQLNGLDKK